MTCNMSLLVKIKKISKTLDFMAKIGYNIKEHKKTQKSRSQSYSSIVNGRIKEKGGLMAKIEEKVEELIKDKIENIGYSLYDVEYAKEGPNYYLRIYIDSPNGIDLNDCEKVSNEINDVLDEANYIKEQYFLEVSSPGIERILRKDSHLEQNIENQVEVKLFKKEENGNKNYIGKLKKFDEDTITVEATDKIDEVKIERKNIAQIKTVFDWDNDFNDEN